MIYIRELCVYVGTQKKKTNLPIVDGQGFAKSTTRAREANDITARLRACVR